MYEQKQNLKGSLDGAGLVLAVVETLETEEVAAGLLAVTAVAETLLGSILTVSVLLQARLSVILELLLIKYVSWFILGVSLSF